MSQCHITVLNKHSIARFSFSYRIKFFIMVIPGLADFTPDQLSDTHSWSSTPGYDDISSVVKKASCWAENAIRRVGAMLFSPLPNTLLRLIFMATINHRLPGRKNVVLSQTFFVYMCFSFAFLHGQCLYQ